MSVQRNERAYAAWERLGSPQYVMAPMVDGSDLPFRAFCRQYGTVLCYAPMVSAKAFTQFVRYKRTLSPLFETEPGDRPLFFQLSGNEPDVVVRAALIAEPHCDGVDLNLGCPQHIAQRSCYGAFLMHHPDKVEKVVRALAAALTTALVCVKIRVFPDVRETVAFAQMLERAGCQVLAVHGRLKEQRGARTGDADWSQIAAVRQAVGIPLIANGNIRTFEDVAACRAATGCDAVMSAWSLLRDPRLFQGPRAAPRSCEDELADAVEWRQWEQRYVGRGISLGRTKLHLFKRLYATLQRFPPLREHLSLVRNEAEMAAFFDMVALALRDPDAPLPPLPPPRVPPVADTSDDAWVLFED